MNRASYWIETDLEPDGVLALWLLPAAQYYVVSDGDTRLKYRRLLAYQQLIPKMKKAKLIQSLSSKYDDRDGKGIKDLPVGHCSYSYLAELVRWSDYATNPTMIVLGSLRALALEYSEHPNLIRYVLGRVRLVCYGGSNFRNLLRFYRSELTAILHSAREVEIFEHYYATALAGVEHQPRPLYYEKINPETFPAVYAHIMENMSKVPFYREFLQLSQAWNRAIIDRAQRELDEPTTPAEVKQRLAELLPIISRHPDFQLSFANCGLAAVWDRVKPTPVANLNFNENGNITFGLDASKTSKIRVWININQATFQRHMLEKMTAMTDNVSGPRA
jgi:hypothetical protein